MVNERTKRSGLARAVSAAAIVVAAAALALLAFGGQSYASSAAAYDYEYAGKVTICHKAGPHGKRVTITVAAAAVPAHRNHGDTMGPCP